MKIESMVKLLLENNADINVLDGDYYKPSIYGNILILLNITILFIIFYIAESKTMKDAFNEAKNKKIPTGTVNTKYIENIIENYFLAIGSNIDITGKMEKRKKSLFGSCFPMSRRGGPKTDKNIKKNHEK